MMYMQSIIIIIIIIQHVFFRHLDANPVIPPNDKVKGFSNCVVVLFSDTH